MKLTMRLMAALLLAIVLVPTPARAQMDPTAPLPLDPEVRTGVLPNGLTYYIRHNETPKGIADFFIAQKVGSILEEDNQRGLAHFLEHMCFNGTENFPGTSLRDWLESNGVMFGRDLNAFTAVDKTVYEIKNVPVGRESVQDSCLLILHDWADALLLEDDEIDSERGVIHQEWRRSNVGNMRILEELLPKLYPGSRYGYRLPIGTMEVVDNFPYQALRDYYETWYRPDQQGIIVVGDIDVDRIEGKIKDLFGPIQMPANPKERKYYEVPDHEGTIYAIGHDKEMSFNIAEMFFLTDATPDSLRNTMAYMLDDYAQDMVAAMFNARIEKLAMDPACPLLQGRISFGDYILAKTKEALEVEAVGKTSEQLEPALKFIYTELLRAATHGFNASELERARAEYLTNLETAYNNRATRRTDAMRAELVNHFTDNTPATGIEVRYQIMSMLAPMIPVEALNELLPEYIKPDNRVVLVMMPDAETYPTEESLAALLAEVEAAQVEAYVDDVKTEPLIPELPAPGSIVATDFDEAFNATVWTLSNGAKVYVQKTPWKEDEIIFRAGANHGTSVFPDADASNLKVLEVAPVGLGTYNTTDLDTYLKGKNASVNSSFGAYTVDFTGSTTPKDLPTLMELIYMNFVDPTIDANEYNTSMSMLRGYLPNQFANPQFMFQKVIFEALCTSPRKQMIAVEDLDAAQPERILEMIKQMVGNAADYTFVFTGNVDLDALRPLVEQYIATLPGDAATAVRAPQYIPETMKKGGVETFNFTMPMTTPQTYLYIDEWANIPYNLKNVVLTDAAEQILSQRLIDTVREKEGAVYSISAVSSIRRLSPQNTSIVIPVPMDPDKRDIVLSLVKKEFDNMAVSVKPEELKKVQEALIKDYRQNIELNSPLSGWVIGYSRNGVDTMTGYEEVVNSITPEDVAAFMAQMNAAGNYLIVLLEPEK